MPFTFSHPAAVLPIHSKFKKLIPLSALVVGSMVPDAAYYLPMPEHFKQTSHTFLGTFSSSLPIGMLVWLVFCWLAAPPGFLLPIPGVEAVSPEPLRSQTWRRLAVGAIAGIWIGAWTHVLWDSFTHERGWFVKSVALLRQPLFSPALPAYKALQYVSSVFGLCVLLYAYRAWLKASVSESQRPLQADWRFYLWTAIGLMCLAAPVIEAHGIHAIADLYVLHEGHPAFVLFTTFIRDILIALCAVSIAAKLFYHERKTKFH